MRGPVSKEGIRMKNGLNGKVSPLFGRIEALPEPYKTNLIRYIEQMLDQVETSFARPGCKNDEKAAAQDVLVSHLVD